MTYEDWPLGLTDVVLGPTITDTIPSLRQHQNPMPKFGLRVEPFEWTCGMDRNGGRFSFFQPEKLP